MSERARRIYLSTIPLDQALARAMDALDRDSLIKSERVPAQEAAGRVAAEPLFARFSSPTYHSAAMDGIAVRAEDTFAAREGEPLRLEEGSDFDPVNTGNVLPEGRNAVIMIENVTRAGDKAVEIEVPAFPWQHVRRIGEDIVATELLFPVNHIFSPYDVGALLGGGLWDVAVWEQPRLHIIPTGNEVLDFEKKPTPSPGQAVESNSQMLRALAKKVGCESFRVPPVEDDPEKLAAALEAGLDSDAHVVVVCAGSSAGSKDFTRKTIERLGEVLVHGVSAMPGKPSLLGVAKGKLVVGAPGYPVSAVVCFEELVMPLLAWLGHFEEPEYRHEEVRLARRSPSKLGVEEFLRLSVGKVGPTLVGTPLGRGAGNITTMCRAQGVARIPINSEGVEKDETVRARLLVPKSQLDRNLVAVGSHDNTLDLLADTLMLYQPAIRLVSSHVGSMGGLMAIKDGTAHMAGCHLFDPKSGDYNFPFLKQYLPNVEVLVVNLAIRHQGLITAKGNPKNILSVNDLARSDIRFINRQRGAGTRILLDHSLDQAGIAAQDVPGYGNEEFTHMAVAVNVLTGAADCGLGIYAAAKALDLDFTPLARERYDIIIPTAYMGDPKIEAVLDILGSTPFKQRVQELGGYETKLGGQAMVPGMGLGE